VNYDPSVKVALEKAVKENHPSIVESILQEGNVDSSWIKHLLNTAVETGNLEMIKIIMGSKSAMQAEAEELGDAIDSALKRNCPAAARIILEARKDAKVPDRVLRSIKDADLVALLLQNKNNQFDPYFGFQVAFNKYAETCRAENVRNILQANPSLDKTYAWTFANSNNCPGVVKILLEGKDIGSGKVGAELCVASSNGRKEIVESILQSGISIRPDDLGRALRYASTQGHKETVESILQSGISFPPDDLGWGLHYVCAFGNNLEIARLYLPWIDQIGYEWKASALLETIKQGHRETALFLIPTLKSIDADDKERAMRIPKRRENQELIDALSAIPLKSS
jgi:ankyrin repeat protein